MAETSSQVGSAGGNSLDFEGLQSDGIHEEIPLGPVLAGALCRRGRRRLRDIQASCQAILRFDRAHSVLHVFGSEEAVQAVRRQLESLGGLRKVIPPAVWAELMRTRTVHDSSQSMLAQLQQESGCRIHIERSQQEVRVFGPDEGTAVAERLLDELANDCIEEVVRTETQTLPTAALQSVAHDHGVTLSIEDDQIIVLGLKDAVHDAVAELQGWIAEHVEVVESQQLPEKLAAQVEAASTASGSSGGCSAGGEPSDAGTNFKERHAVNRMTLLPGSNGEMLDPVSSPYFGLYAQACTTCGTALFCPGCGTVVTGGCGGLMTYMPVQNYSLDSFGNARGCDSKAPGMAADQGMYTAMVPQQ